MEIGQPSTFHHIQENKLMPVQAKKCTICTEVFRYNIFYLFILLKESWQATLLCTCRAVSLRYGCEIRNQAAHATILKYLLLFDSEHVKAKQTQNHR